MKELSIEEKAKRYDESIARAKKLMETCDSAAVVGWCEYIFKELRESEDEKIRKSLIQGFNECLDSSSYLKNAKKYWYGIAIDDILTWLEKQGDKPLNDADEDIVEAVKDTSVLDMVEPKFKAGQWIIDTQDGGILHINKALEYAYEVTNLKGGVYQISRCSIETSYKPWIIQDAKDGDVLFSPSHNLLWLHKDEELCHVCINLNYNDSLSIETDFVTPSDVSPAIKEQHDLLFQKIKEAGYEWDAEKKKLKKIKPKPNWSEKDENILDNIIAYKYLNIDDLDWLKSLKDRVQLQPQKEWSEEDEEMLEDIRFNYESNKSGMTEGLIEQYNKWFEKIKSLKPQSKQEWSDENKKIIDDIIEYLECFNDFDCGDEPYEEYYERFEKYIKFMESLKPQSQWKPSDEHIRYLQAVVNDAHNIGSESCCIALRDLLEQLKKF